MKKNLGIEILGKKTANQIKQEETHTRTSTCIQQEKIVYDPGMQGMSSHLALSWR